MKNINDMIVGGLQEHQYWRNDGISPTLTSAMGMGGGQTPCIIIVEYEERYNNDRAAARS